MTEPPVVIDPDELTVDQMRQLDCALCARPMHGPRADIDSVSVGTVMAHGAILELYAHRACVPQRT